MRILAVSGSLRLGSSNGAIVDAAVLAAGDTAAVTVFGLLSALPPFNPDLERESTPPAVAAWRDALRASSAVLISSPEYAHGVPGVLKNALDWVVGSGEFMSMPVALVNASAYSAFVTEQLRETLTVMMAEVVVATSLPLRGRPSSAADILAQPLATAELRAALQSLAEAAHRVAERSS
ncbi:MAG: NAD(P)H-dependent oxidoreductase [Gemmatimonadaceae bacterium]|nr:NAD(P)H-dependent oxidoreductase [Gemmatimonadaceae bacterium]